jgi:hypothetical protein
MHDAAHNLSQWQVATVEMSKIQVLMDKTRYMLVGSYRHSGRDYYFLRQVRLKCRNMSRTCCRPTSFKLTMGLQFSRRCRTLTVATYAVSKEQTVQTQLPVCPH